MFLTTRQSSDTDLHTIYSRDLHITAAAALYIMLNYDGENVFKIYFIHRG